MPRGLPIFSGVAVAELVVLSLLERQDGPIRPFPFNDVPDDESLSLGGDDRGLLGEKNKASFSERKTQDERQLQIQQPLRSPEATRWHKVYQ